MAAGGEKEELHGFKDENEELLLIKELKRIGPQIPKDKRIEIFNRISEKYKVTVCLGCGNRFEDDKDDYCDCPAGTCERLKSDAEIAELMNSKGNCKREDTKMSEENEAEPVVANFLDGDGAEPTVADFLEEFKQALFLQLVSDHNRWGNTWLKRPKKGQEDRTRKRFDAYFDQFENAGTPVPWLKIVGGALICWIREKHPELCELWIETEVKEDKPVDRSECHRGDDNLSECCCEDCNLLELGTPDEDKPVDRTEPIEGGY